MLSQEKKVIVVCTDLGSADPDDLLALLWLLYFLVLHPNYTAYIIATHFYSERRAEMAAKLFEDLCAQGRVFILVGVSPADYAEFSAQNPLFPSEIFGYPFNTDPSRKTWFPKFGAAFASVPPTAGGFQRASDVLPKLLAEATAPVLYCAIAPPHDLLNVPEELLPKLDIWAMGGWMDKNGVNMAGYNWGPCYATTEELLARLRRANCALTLVSADLVRETDTSLPVETLNAWLQAKDVGILSPLGSQVVQEILNCYGGNLLSENKRLSDPLTVMLAVLSTLGGEDLGLELRRCDISMPNASEAAHYLQLRMEPRYAVSEQPDEALPIKNIERFNLALKSRLIADLDLAFREACYRKLEEK